MLKRFVTLPISPLTSLCLFLSLPRPQSLPAKNEKILRVEMCPLQKLYYKYVLTRNFEQLNKGSRGATTSLLNIVIQVIYRRCCLRLFLALSFLYS